MDPNRMRTAGLVATVIMIVMAIVGGVINLAGIELPLSHELGMPPYVGLILGTAKLLGAATFATRRLPRLREWAYAGLTFELLGAAACHVLANGGVLHAAPALFDLSFVVVSYFGWHRSHAHPREEAMGGDAAPLLPVR